MKKSISNVLYLVLFVSLLVISNPMQVSALPPTSISSGELEKLSDMTLDELKKAARPMPEAALGTIGSTNLITVKLSSRIPQDGGIYYIENTIKGNIYLEFYRMLYVSPSGILNSVTYHEYVWNYVNDKFHSSYVRAGDEDDPELWMELIGQDPTDHEDDSNNQGEKEYTLKRLSGLTRTETAKAIAEEYNSGMVQNLVLTTGENFPDALAGSVLARKFNAPILLTGSTIEESADALDYVKSHLTKDGTVSILGGPGAVDESIVESIKEMGIANVKRVAGNSRYDTSKAIADELKVEEGTPVIVTTGENFPDALSISSIASAKGYPILLTDLNSLPTPTEDALKAIKPKTIYIIGGEGAVSNEVASLIRNIVGLTEKDIVRLAGSGRYETSLAIAKYFNLESKTVAFATGENFPDALAGSVLAAYLNAPIVLLGDEVTKQKAYIDGTTYEKIIIFGGEGAVSKAITESLMK